VKKRYAIAGRCDPSRITKWIDWKLQPFAVRSFRVLASVSSVTGATSTTSYRMAPSSVNGVYP